MEFKNQNENRTAIANRFLDMFRHQLNCDVSLVIAGRMMKAHKHILSTFSTFFKEIFDELEANSSMATNLGANVAFLNYKYDHVEALIKYMYTGVLRVNKDEWPQVLKCATDLGITAIIEYSKQPESTANESTADNKRKLEDRGKEKSNTVEAKRSKNDAPKESISISDPKRKDSQSSNSAKQQRESTAEDILSGVSFDHSARRSEKTNNSLSNTHAKTQITKISKPAGVSEASKESNSKSSNDLLKKETNSSSSHKLLPTAASTPKSNNISSEVKSSRPRRDDSDDSMEYSPFNRTKGFSDKLKELQSTLTDTSKSNKDNNKEQGRPDSASRIATNQKEEKPSEPIKCGKCGKAYPKGTHLSESELPTPPAMCPMQGCEKMMKMNRMLKDHLTKFHKVSLCEEK